MRIRRTGTLLMAGLDNVYYSLGMNYIHTAMNSLKKSILGGVVGVLLFTLIAWTFTGSRAVSVVVQWFLTHRIETLAFGLVMIVGFTALKHYTEKR
jgi:hypothetical protein